jgi:cytochrome c-type biogenesis protein CcmH
MFEFWLAAALLLLISLFVIIITLLRSYDDNDASQESDTELYQQRLAEIELDIENGLLEGSEAKKVKKELQLSLLNQDKSKQGKSISTDSSSSTITAILLLILTPVFVIGIYKQLGQPDLIEKAALLSDFHNAGSEEEKMASIEKMLSQLEQRLINEPDDIDGWLMLTNSYSALERYPEALRAVDNLYRLRSNDPSVMIRYADILSLTNGGVLTGRPTELINEALQLDPENTSGLWLAGLAANERGDIDEAISYWQRVIPKLEEDSEQQQQIKEYIEMISQHVNPDQKDSLTNTDKPEHKIQVNVSLSENLIDETDNNDTVFIYAQAVNGPPVPIAVVRKKVSDLPIQTILDDSMAMMPNNKLSDHKQVKLTARISKSGNAIAEPGDLIGTVDTVQTSLNETIFITISQKIP